MSDYIRRNKIVSALVCLLGVALLGVVWAADTDVRLYDKAQVQVHTGTTDIDASAADYTSFQALLTIAPPNDAAMQDVLITLDLNKTTTGYLAVTDGSITGQLALQRKIDGTNWRTDVASIQTLTAVAWEQSKSFEVRTIEPTAALRVVVLQSSEAGDMEIPYRVTYRSTKAATFTDVAN